jgi:hypothetical protein
MREKRSELKEESPMREGKETRDYGRQPHLREERQEIRKNSSERGKKRDE